jgi:hypothetical protein
LAFPYAFKISPVLIRLSEFHLHTCLGGFLEFVSKALASKHYAVAGMKRVRQPPNVCPPVCRAGSFLAVLLALFAINVLAESVSPRFSHEVYVWQRKWTDEVSSGVRARGGTFSAMVALNAEVSFHENEPEIHRFSLDFPALRATGHPVGLALRVGPYRGSFSPETPLARRLAGLARACVEEARAAGVELSELQLDFDCAESKLDGYREWVRLIREKVRPTPITITALPSWLNQPAFPNLAAITDGYILQVHSLERPKSVSAPFSLCDPAAARSAVERANRIGVPFRVALPTYGYSLAFRANGQFLGLSAEGPRPSWPANAQLREVRADPVEMAKLAFGWSTNRPRMLRGIIWYRLPIESDILNWRWRTLDAIVHSRFPRESFRVESRRVEAGLVEIQLVNDGELDISSRLAVEAHWADARMVAGDALNGFEMAETGTSAVRFQHRSQSERLPAGEKRVIGWLRFEKDREVQVECSMFSSERRE